MKLSRIASAVTVAAIAPAVLLASPALAQDTTPSAPSAPTSPDQSLSGADEQAEKDRIEILRIIGAAKPGSVLAEAGSAAIDQGPAAMREFLETGQHVARDQDNRILITQIISTGGRGVQKAGRAALEGTPADRVAFLETGQHTARDEDNKVEIVRLLNGAGPA
ncbi:ALF repeat-containing protein, partial [Streptomyces sp. NPDC003023]|uniref:ALF repeat-containing protein n=1 Tax=Streptomyces sp. NPDC003023 TaxID=3364675 RepID=UPI0036CD4A30